jgi:GcrA cell cycle regulator
MPDWTEEATAKLKELRQTESASGISRKLAEQGFGSFSRSAIIGKMHRLGLRSEKPVRGQPSARKIVREKKFADRQFSPTRRVLKREKREVGKTLIELQKDDCRWPHGDGSDIVFCGDVAITGSSYCASHARMACARSR